MFGIVAKQDECYLKSLIMDFWKWIKKVITKNKIYRKFVYSKDELDRGLAEIIIAKHRNGPTGNVDLAFFDNFAKFDNLDYRHQDVDIAPTPTVHSLTLHSHTTD